MTETVPPAEEAEVDFSFIEEFKSDQPAAADDEKTEDSSDQALEAAVEAKPPTESVEEQPAVDVSPPAAPSKTGRAEEEAEGLGFDAKGIGEG